MSSALDPAPATVTRVHPQQRWDGELVVTHFDAPTRSMIFIAVHNTTLGPATGGTRMMHYASPDDALEDALRLARGMTLKFAVPRFACGGGKAVIAIPATLEPEARLGLLRRYGGLLKKLNGLFYTGPDVGTSTADMDVIAETGAPYVFSRSVGKGGAGDSSGFTALGVYRAILATFAQLDGEGSPAGKTVLIQGLGNVGRKLLAHLRRDGIRVRFSDVNPALRTEFAGDPQIEFIPPDEIHATPCDVFAPCALGGGLNAETIPQLRCRAVVGAANNQLQSPEMAERLRARGILYAPDFVVNIGGAMGITGMEAMGWSEADATREVEKVGATLREIYARAAAENITTLAAAHRLAEANLLSAQSRSP